MGMHAGRRAGRGSGGWGSQTWKGLRWRVPRLTGRVVAAIGDQRRRLDYLAGEDDRRRLAEVRVGRAGRGGAQIEGVIVVVLDASTLGSRRRFTCRFRLVIVVMPVVIVVTTRFVEVAVVEVNPSRLFVVVRRFVHVGQAGHGAERQVEGATAHCENATHREILYDEWSHGASAPAVRDQKERWDGVLWKSTRLSSSPR